jgi:hypothetical protein
VRDIEIWKNFNVYYTWDWNKSPFDINSVVFHFDDFNYGRRTATRKKWTPAWNSVVTKYHVRDEELWRNFNKDIIIINLISYFCIAWRCARHGVTTYIFLCNYVSDIFSISKPVSTIIDYFSADNNSSFNENTRYPSSTSYRNWHIPNIWPFQSSWGPWKQILFR